MIRMLIVTRLSTTIVLGVRPFGAMVAGARYGSE